jgi:hypothetical protein
MDLAKYCVNDVLVEGRSVRAVAAATGLLSGYLGHHTATLLARQRSMEGSDLHAGG